jgi:DNA-binding GntR family transcriptional regulator
MRGPTPRQILNTQPPELRAGSKTTHAYLETRRRILTGEYKPDQIIVPKEINEEYGLSNASTQLLLLRLANEGLIKITPVKERTWPYNAAINEYHVAELNTRKRILSTRHGGFVSDISQQGYRAYLEVREVRVEYADAEVASLLNIAEGDKVVFYSTLQRSDPNTVIAISDTYLPFWFSEVLPELYKPDCDIYQLMRQPGKNPFWCTEDVDTVQASSTERVQFGMSPDDPCALLKILRRVFDDKGTPMSVDYLTDRGDIYRLHYSFNLFAENIPEALRGY